MLHQRVVTGLTSGCRSLLFVFFLSVAANGRASGQAPPQPADQIAINSAIQKGVQYLRNSQNPSGGWGAGTKAGSDGGWAVGYASLAGLTLIECGASPGEPGLQAAASGVRSYGSDLDSTYEVSLAILFLDRMGEKSDRKLIQLLAGRLIAGQSSTGGWGYKVPNKNRSDIDQLFSALRKLSPPQAATGPSSRERPASLGLCIKQSDDLFLRPAPPFDPDKARAAALASLPASMKKLPVFNDPTQLASEDPKDKSNDALNPTTDNSNTHFAALALWAARKYDVPTDRSFAMLANRFRTSQGGDGTWAYNFNKNGAGGPPSMTCVALLGLAIGHVLNADPSVRPEKDPRVINAFTALSKQIGEPAGQIDGRPTPESKGGLYFMWGMERIAVLYDVRQLDKKDWYLWGAEILLCHQKTDGSWEKGGYHGEHPVLNTCFALLFLKRANLTPDLSRKLTVDAAALTQKLTTPIARAPSKPPEPAPVVVETAPYPRAVEPKPKIEPTPAVAAEVPVSTPPQPEPTLKWPWIIALSALILFGLACIIFGIRKRKDKDDGDDEEEDEERPGKNRRKRGGKNGQSRREEKRREKTKAVSKRPDSEED